MLRVCSFMLCILCPITLLLCLWIQYYASMMYTSNTSASRFMELYVAMNIYFHKWNGTRGGIKACTPSQLFMLRTVVLHPVFSPGFTGQRAQVIIHDHAPHLAHAVPLRVYAMPLNSCRVLLSIMLPKAKKP